MSEKHVVVCDGCKAEKLIVTRAVMHVGTLSGSSSPMDVRMEKPSDWHTVSGRDFCSWACVADFAKEQGAA